MDGEDDEAAVLADGGDERQGLHLQVGVVHLDSVPPVGPVLGPERPEREHRLVQVDDSGLRLVYLIQQLVHAVEQRVIVRVREVDLPLASLDGLEPDLVPQIYAADSRRGDNALAEASVKQLRSLSKGQVGGLLQGRWCN